MTARGLCLHSMGSYRDETPATPNANINASLETSERLMDPYLRYNGPNRRFGCDSRRIPTSYALNTS